MDHRDVLAPLAIVAAIGGTWAWTARQNRRFRKAIDAVLARFPGNRYEPGGRFSGGTLYLTLEGRQVVFSFNLAHSARSASTVAGVLLDPPVPAPWTLKRRAALDREPRLAAFRGLFALGLEIGASSNLLRVEVPGIVRDADRLVELASIAAALAARV
jgi:hypothetical protein